MITVNIIDEIARLQEHPRIEIRGSASGKSYQRWRIQRHAVDFKKGAILTEHRNKDPIVVQVISGSIQFKAGSERTISAGQMVGLEPNTSHSVEALEESAIIIIALPEVARTPAADPNAVQ